MLFTTRNAFEDGELPALYEIERECFPKELRWVESAFRQEMTAARKLDLVWVACLGTRIAGFLIATIQDNKVYIETCNVARLHRHKGIATRLIAACERAARQRGYKGIKLEVYVENPAQVLYFKLGYRACGFKWNFYGSRKHAISMAKRV